MKILFITQEYSSRTAGGAGVYAYEIINALAEAKITVHVIAPSTFTKTEQISQYIILHWQKVIPLPLFKVPSFHISVAIRARKIIKQHCIEIIHSNNNAGIFIWSKLPFIATVHHLVIDDIKRPAAVQKFIYFPDWVFEKVLFWRARAIITVSNTIRKQILDIRHLDNVFTIPNGIDLELFTRVKTSIKKDMLSVASGKLILFFPGGGRARRKGGLDLIRALTGLTLDNVICVVTGESREAGWSQEFTKAIAEAELNDIFIFIGEVPYDDLPKFYSIADIVLFPSTFEGFGLPVLEALACGRPLICTSTGEAASIVKPGVNGLLIKPNDWQDLRHQIMILMSDAQLRSLLSKNGRKSISQYNWQQLTYQLILLYEKNIGQYRV